MELTTFASRSRVSAATRCTYIRVETQGRNTECVQPLIIIPARATNIVQLSLRRDRCGLIKEFRGILDHAEFLL